jgi:hypothetical protein
MSEVVTLLEKLFEEEKALKGQRNEAERAGRKARASGRAQTARGVEEEEEERVGARTWEGGRKGLVDDDATNQKHDVRSLRSTLFRSLPFFSQRLRVNAGGGELLFGLGLRLGLCATQQGQAEEGQAQSHWRPLAQER